MVTKSRLSMVMLSPFMIPLSIRLLAILMSLVVGGVILGFSGVNPMMAYASLFRGALGSVVGLGETLAIATPLLIIGLGLTVSFKVNVYNIGAEGQMWLGGLFAALIGLWLEVPSIAHLLLMGVGGILAGMLWSLLPAILKAKLETNEIITTLMMNYIAILFIGYLLWNPLMCARNQPMTELIATSAWLPKLISGTRLHAGFIIGILCIPIVYLFLFKTSLGYELRAVGAGPEAARSEGINLSKNIVLSMLISGGLAGLAGMIEVSGVHHRMMEGFSPGYGYLAVLVALLGKLHPIGVSLAAFLIGGLYSGGRTMHVMTKTPIFFVDVIVGLVLLFTLIGEAIVSRRGSS